MHVPCGFQELLALWPETYQYISVLLKIRRTPLLGNNDEEQFSGLIQSAFHNSGNKALPEDLAQAWSHAYVSQLSEIFLSTLLSK